MSKPLRPLLLAAALLLSPALRAEPFSFVALGDLPYGEKAKPAYRALIERINEIDPAFAIHVGDFKSGSTLCSDAEFAEQKANFQRFSGALIYTPGDNEWTDCHRPNNGGYDPLERLQALRRDFYDGQRSLGQRPIALESQSRLMPAHSRQVENQRWQRDGVLFVTLHIVGSNNNLQQRDAAAALEGDSEFAQRDAANVAWIRDAFEQAAQRKARALVFAFQADPFEQRGLFDDFPGWSGFGSSVGRTLLPLAARWGKPVLVIHGDSHSLKTDRPFRLEGQPLANVSRLEVPGAGDIRAVLVQVDGDRFDFEPFAAQR